MTLPWKTLKLNDAVEYRALYDKSWQSAAVTTLTSYRSAGGQTHYSVQLTVGPQAPMTGMLVTLTADEEGYVRQIQNPQPGYASGALVEYLDANGKWLKGVVIGYRDGTNRMISYEVRRVDESNSTAWYEGSKLRPRTWTPKFAVGDYVDVEFKMFKVPDNWISPRAEYPGHMPGWAFGHPSLEPDISTVWESGRILKIDKVTEMYTILNIRYNNQMFAKEAEMRKTEFPKTLKELEAEVAKLKAENEKLSNQLKAVKEALK